MVFGGRGNGPTPLIGITNLPWVPKNMCTKFHKISKLLLKLSLARTDGRTDSHPDFNSSRHPGHLHPYNFYMITVTTVR